MSLLPEINQASAEINKFVAQANIHQTIAPVNPAAFTDPADTALMASRDPVIREVSVGMSGEELTQYTVSGTPPLSLPNSLGKPLKAWEVDVLPYQEGSGDPSPDNVRPIHGTDKLNLFVEESYDPTATPKAVLTLPSTVYTGTIGSEGGESRTIKFIPNINNKQSTNQYGISNWAFNFYPPIAVNSLSMCELLKKQTTIISQTTNEGYFLSNSTSGYLRLDESRAATVAECNQWIADNGFYLIVTLATPTTFAVPSVTIPTPSGTATTWATAEDGTVDGMEVTYIGKA